MAKRHILPEVRHRQSRYLDNYAENSHRPTRRREQQMQRFESSDQAQRFLSALAVIYGHFRPRHRLMAATDYRCLSREGPFGFGSRKRALTSAHETSGVLLKDDLGFFAKQRDNALYDVEFLLFIKLQIADPARARPPHNGYSYR